VVGLLLHTAGMFERLFFCRRPKSVGAEELYGAAFAAGRRESAKDRLRMAVRARAYKGRTIRAWRAAVAISSFRAALGPKTCRFRYNRKEGAKGITAGRKEAQRWSAANLWPGAVLFWIHSPIDVIDFGWALGARSRSRMIHVAGAPALRKVDDRGSSPGEQRSSREKVQDAELGRPVAIWEEARLDCGIGLSIATARRTAAVISVYVTADPAFEHHFARGGCLP